MSFWFGCKLGPTQYWPNPPPKTCRKRKAPVKSEIGDVHKAESKDKEIQEANPPISTGIIDDGVVNVALYYAETTLDQSLSDKCFNTPTKAEGKLTKTKNVDAVNYENPSELYTPRKHGDDSMRKLE